MKNLQAAFLILGSITLAAATAPGSGRTQPKKRSPQPEGPVHFVRDIQPILQASCYPCHGSEKQGANLRLDNRESAFTGGISGAVIVPGKPDESLIYRRIAGLGDDPQMPLKGKKLSPDQIRRIRTWIQGGAHWPEDAGGYAAQVRKHWAYTKPVRPELPRVQNESWVRNPIDRFVLAKLEQTGLRPAPEASKETLVRRLSIDLIGLPPTLQEIDDFLTDASPDAYERVVERLLASPRYGERWARPWLDLARYADTHGYEADRRRSMWLYRDWVIAALNKDMPFDQFTIEQIAGDLLPNATLDQRIATGFHRNTMINEEGGVDPEEYRVAAIVDRVDTTSSVWLGTTLGCAQCHNHKFDPFSQEEYYRVFAFFNNVEPEVQPLPGGGRETRPPNLTVPAPRALAEHRKQVEDQIAGLERELRTRTPGLDASQRKWEQEAQAVLLHWNRLDATQVTSAAGATLARIEDRSVLASGQPLDHDTYLIVTNTDDRTVSGVRLEALSDPSLPNGGVSRSPSGNFILTGFEVEIASLQDPDRTEVVRFTDALAQNGTNVKAALDDNPATGWTFRPSREGPQDTQAIFIPKEPFGFEGGTRITVRLKHESSSAQNVIGRFRLSVASAKDPGRSSKVPVRIQEILIIPESQRSQEQQENLRAYYQTIAPSLAAVRERLARLRALWAELAAPSTLVMKELAEQRTTHIHIRGNFLNKGKEVGPGTPAVLHSLPKDTPANRLALARWLVDPDNPLVGRVTMNRLWMYYFGTGIVETAEDFGSQGHQPAHPDLLDWLATEFVGQKWSMKAMHRLIVTSAAYRQNSHSPDRLERDPNNRLLARAPRLRLEAEMVRDNALAIAGLLSPKVGGPSVFPPQPEGVWNLVYNNDTWINSLGDDRYRRGIYTFWRRTAPYPAFITFDAPSREFSCTRRITTNTPLQSLTTLNDPVFFDAARGLARRIVLEAPPDVHQGVAYAFRLCTARKPEQRELARLVALFDQELAHFSQDLQRAKDIALGGDVTPPKEVDLSRFAAWTILANVLLNLDETLTKG